MDSEPGTRDQRRWLYEDLAARLASMIQRGTYRPGDRLPSVRQLSKQQEVSISTVLQAYYLLEDRGLIEARPQSGYYVSARPVGALPEPEISSPEPDPSDVGVQELVLMVLRDTLKPNLLQFGTAIPHPDLLATGKINRILASIAREDRPQDAMYAFPPGREELRLAVAQRAVAAGCSLAPNDVVVTSGGDEAMHLCLRATCRPGDTVAIESPMYFGTLQILEALGLRALEIPTHPRTGISLEALRFAIDHNPVRACMVMSNFNNPLGSRIPDGNQRELVAMLARRDIPLIENDSLGELYFSGERPGVAKAHDRKGLVLLCSSFSEDLGPGYRIGWTAPGRFKADVEWYKLTTNVATATLPQLAIAQFVASAGYDHHLRRVRRGYAQRMAGMSRAIERHFPQGVRATRPDGGHVLWVQLPEDVDSLELYRLSIRSGVTLAPGHIFSATEQYRNFIRLNAAFWSPEADPALQRLGEIVTSLASR
jgi:DNA-binding transcriptional MocR family regulator